MQVKARKAVDAVQYSGDKKSLDAVLKAGGDRVHVGVCGEIGEELPHLSTDKGNIPLHKGSWLIKDGEDVYVMSEADFAAQYQV